MGDLRKLKVYKKGMSLSQEIFELSKMFPNEERYSLTDQIRRSSRSITANLGEAYRKRQYSAHFVSKVSDADMENTETQVWLEYALSCNYISLEKFQKLVELSIEVGRLLNDMIKYPEKYS